MITIYAQDNHVWTWSPDTKRLFRDNTLVPRSVAEPTFWIGEDSRSEFNGIYLPGEDTLITKSGKIHKVVDINSIK